MGKQRPRASQGTQATPVTTSQSSGLWRSGDPQCLGHVYLTVGPVGPWTHVWSPPVPECSHRSGYTQQLAEPMLVSCPAEGGLLRGEGRGKPPGPPGPRKIVKQSSEASPTGVQRSAPRQGPRAQEWDAQHGPLLLGLCRRRGPAERQTVTAKLVRWQLQPQPLLLTWFRC